MTLGGEIIDLIGLNLSHNADQPGSIVEVAVMEREIEVPFMRIQIKMIDAIGIEKRGA